jgi:hypothetical protein
MYGRKLLYLVFDIYILRQQLSEGAIRAAGLVNCEMLKTQYCLDSRVTDGSEIDSLGARPRNIFFICVSGIHFC